jgi:hypothetical protein
MEQHQPLIDMVIHDGLFSTRKKLTSGVLKMRLMTGHQYRVTNTVTGGVQLKQH